MARDRGPDRRGLWRFGAAGVVRRRLFDSSFHRAAGSRGISGSPRPVKLSDRPASPSHDRPAHGAAVVEQVGLPGQRRRRRRRPGAAAAAAGPAAGDGTTPRTACSLAGTAPTPRQQHRRRRRRPAARRPALRRRSAATAARRPTSCTRAARRGSGSSPGTAAGRGRRRRPRSWSCAARSWARAALARVRFRAAGGWRPTPRRGRSRAAPRRCGVGSACGGPSRSLQPPAAPPHPLPPTPTPTPCTTPRCHAGPHPRVGAAGRRRAQRRRVGAPPRVCAGGPEPPKVAEPRVQGEARAAALRTRRGLLRDPALCDNGTRLPMIHAHAHLRRRSTSARLAAERPL
jgi:hypothetical protein